MRAKSIDIKQIKIQDAFWSKHVDLVRKVILPYQWDAINDRIKDAEPSHSLENFKIAAHLSEGEFYGAVFQDTDVAKWLEAVGFTLACYPDRELEKTADQVIDIIAMAQRPDGYINTYFTIKEPDKRWRNLAEGHELYTAGHLMEAAVAYYQGTGKRKLLDCLCRFADLICDTFGWEEEKIHGYPGHEEVEIGLFKLFLVTGEKRYLNQAKYFIDARGTGENYFLQEMKRPDYLPIFPEMRPYDPAYFQSHLPVREQDTAEGHAVRAVYLYTAMADLAEVCGDEELLRACERLWANITEKRMYVTGGIGSSGFLERFTTDYDLPNDSNYSESCASIGLAMFGLRMAQITGKAKYMDVVERALYNTVLAGIALDGKSFFYVNPLEVWPPACMDRTSKQHVKAVRQKWFGVACCPPNIARTLASLGQYLYSWQEEEQKLYVNLFASGQVSLETRSGTLTLSVETRFPWENKIDFRISGAGAEGVTLMVRIPDYAENYRVCRSGKTLSFKQEKGYARIGIAEGMELTAAFEAKPRFVRADPRLRYDAGRVALMRGPLVYCLEEIDNGENLSALFVDTDREIEEETDPLFGGIVRLKVHGERIVQDSWKEGLYGSAKPAVRETVLTAIPYPYWNNRGVGEMAVWLKEK